MGIVVVCESCGKHLSIPESLYDKKVRGRVVTIACKRCGGRVRVDGTQDGVLSNEGSEPDTSPDQVDEALTAAQESLPPAPVSTEFGGAAATAFIEARVPKDVPPPDFGDPGEDTDRERQVSYADGAISVHGPSATIGRYALFGQFAAGGMATVHLGRLDGAGGFSRVVAIKRLLPHLVRDREFTEMLLKEARLAARVRHPNVVPTLDVVASKGDVLLVMEYVHGEALSTLCRIQAKEVRDFIPIEVAVSIMLGVLQGLHAVHEATDEKGRPLELIHRDVSPPNVLVGSDGLSRVLDFGIAKALQQLEESLPHQLKGKSGYMSPEQIRGERLTRRSDVFAAAIILWEALTLRRLFSAAAETERMAKILAGNYPKPSQFRNEISPEIDEVVMKALAFDPERRFATVGEFSEALERVAPNASARVVADWVNALAREPLAIRARMVAQVENWNENPDIELNSTPFASEALAQSRSQKEHEEELRSQRAEQVRISGVPPNLGALAAAGGSSSRAELNSDSGKSKGGGLLFWVMVLLVVGTVAFLALRG